MALEEGVAIPILLGKKNIIENLMEEYAIELPGLEIIDPKSDDQIEKRNSYGKVFFENRKRKGFTEYEAIQIMRERNYYGSMMVDQGDADAMITGVTRGKMST